MFRHRPFLLSHDYKIKVIQTAVDSQTSSVKEAVSVIIAPPWTVLETVKAVSEAIHEYGDINIDSKGVAQVQCKEGISLLFPSSLTHILGFKSPLFSGNKTASLSIDTELFASRMVVTSNFNESVQVGHRFEPLLYYGPLCSHTECSAYRKTADRDVTSIQLRFYNTLLEEINVADNSFSIMIHFRKKP